MNYRALLLALLVLVAGPLQAGKLNVNHYPQDAAWAIHFDVEQALKGKVFPQFAAMIQFAAIREQARAQKGALESPLAEGLKRLESIRSIAAYGTLADGSDTTLVIDMDYTPKSIRREMSLPAKPAATYHAISMFAVTPPPTAAAPASTRYMAFYDTKTILVAMTQKAMTRQIDLLQGRGAPLTKTAPLSLQLQAGQGAMFVLAAHNLPQFLADSPDVQNSALIKKIQAVCLTFRETSSEQLELQLSLAANSSQTATQLRRLLDGTLAGLELLREDSPEIDTLLTICKFKIAGEANLASITASTSMTRISAWAIAKLKAENSAPKPATKPATKPVAPAKAKPSTGALIRGLIRIIL